MGWRKKIATIHPCAQGKKDNPGRLVNNFLHNKLPRIEEETSLEEHSNNPVVLVLPPSETIYQHTLTAYIYLQENDDVNFSYYKHLFDEKLKNHLHFKEEWVNLIVRLGMRHKDLSSQRCCAFSWFICANTAKLSKSLTTAFIRAFLCITSIDDAAASQKYADAVNQLIVGSPTKSVSHSV